MLEVFIKKEKSSHFHIYFLIFLSSSLETNGSFPKKVFSVYVFGPDTVLRNHSMELSFTMGVLAQSLQHGSALLSYGQTEQKRELWQFWISFLLHSAASK